MLPDDLDDDEYADDPYVDIPLPDDDDCTNGGPVATVTPLRRVLAHEPENKNESTNELPARVDWHELYARDRTEGDWLIADLWPRGRMISITAPYKGRKSLLALYLAACLAGGRDPWTGRATPPVCIGYLDFEMTEDDLLERCEDMGFKPDDLDRLVYYLRPTMPMLDTPEGGKTVLRLIQRDRLEALVIDTFSRVVDATDNAGREVREFYRWTASHAKAAGVSVARLDHTGHADRTRAIGTVHKGTDVDVGWVIHSGDDRTLRLDHHGLSRLGWVPQQIDLVQLDSPLRFARAQRAWDSGTLACAAELDRLGLTLDVSANAAQKALRDAGKGQRRAVVQQAVSYRQERAR